MFVKNRKECETFVSGDGAILEELLHPDKQGVNISYSLAHAIVKPGITTKPHKLKTTEVYYILKGKGEMHIDDETKEVIPGDAIYIPPNATQYIKNTSNEDLDFICLVSPPWRLEDEEVLD